MEIIIEGLQIHAHCVRRRRRQKYLINARLNSNLAFRNEEIAKETKTKGQEETAQCQIDSGPR